MAAGALELPVLVLNRNYQPVAITRARRAFQMLFTGAARALDENYRVFDFGCWSEVSAQLGDDVVRTPRLVLKVPRVILLQAYGHVPTHQIRFSRQNIFVRDRFTCQYCGKRKSREELNLDHVNPRAQGGKSTWENVVCSCVPCNLTKAGRTPAQAKMLLLKDPVRPTWSHLHKLRQTGIPYQEWKPFLDPVAASYWHTILEP